MDVLAIFFFVVLFWLLIVVFAFRRHDISGWIKAIWVMGLIVFPYVAVLAYLIFQGRGMSGRNVRQAQQARDELRRVVGFSAADEIQKLDGLKNGIGSGTPNLQDYVPGSSSKATPGRAERHIARCAIARGRMQPRQAALFGLS